MLGFPAPYLFWWSYKSVPSIAICFAWQITYCTISSGWFPVLLLIILYTVFLIFHRQMSVLKSNLFSWNLTCALYVQNIPIYLLLSVWQTTIAVNTVWRLLMMDSKPVWNISSCISEYVWQIVHLFCFYFIIIAQCTGLRMLNWNMSLSSDMSQQYTDFKICPIIIILFSVIRELCHCHNIVGAKLTKQLFVLIADQI